MPHRALCGPIVARFSFVFSSFDDAVSAPSLRTNYRPLGLESCWGLAVSHACRTERFADRLWHAFSLFLAVSTMPFRHPVCGRITDPLGVNPAGVWLFRMHAAQSPLRTELWHALASFCFAFIGFKFRRCRFSSQSAEEPCIGVSLFRIRFP